MSYKIIEKAQQIFDSAREDYCKEFQTTIIRKDAEFLLKFLSIQLAKMEEKLREEIRQVDNKTRGHSPGTGMSGS